MLVQLIFIYEESCWLEVMLKVIPACKCLYNWGWNPLHPQGKPTWGAMYRQVVRWMCWVLWCCTQDCISYFFWLLDVGNPGCILVFRVSSHKSCCDGSVKKKTQVMGSIFWYSVFKVWKRSPTHLLPTTTPRLLKAAELVADVIPMIRQGRIWPSNLIALCVCE